MKRTEIKYALMHKKENKLVGYYTSSNADGDFCCDNQYILSITEDNIWYVDSAEYAEWVRHNSTQWFNAGYDTPTHNYVADDLAVVKVEIIMNIEEIDIDIPSYKQMSEFKARGNKRDFDYYMIQKKEHPEITYGFYDLREWLRMKKKK